MMGLSGKKLLQMKKVLFPQMIMGAFSEQKIIWQDLAQLQPKTDFHWCQIFLKSFQKWIHRGAKSDFMAPNNFDI